ncbi:HNH endonuclease [Microbispora rosea]|uniref:HNH endonuclease n=1 Tax=Microbispora rosea TaxID=58117 RepID=UPI0004C2D47D|nr:HNH endonuclease [Microbispora rosea]
MSVTAKVRQAVLERDNYACVSCGQSIIGRPYSLQHRRARKMGGSRLSWIDQPQNLITVCGTATTPDCHWKRMESRPTDAKGKGYVISEWPEVDPRLIPVEVLTENGKQWLWLTPGGERSTVPPADAEMAECDVHVAFFACPDCTACKRCGPCGCELVAGWQQRTPA